MRRGEFGYFSIFLTQDTISVCKTRTFSHLAEGVAQIRRGASSNVLALVQDLELGSHLMIDRRSDININAARVHSCVGKAWGG